MDEKYLEIADALTVSIVETSIKMARQKQTKPDDFDGTCTCGADVDPRRIRAGYFNCVDCQEKIERRSKFYRGA